MINVGLKLPSVPFKVRSSSKPAPQLKRGAQPSPRLNWSASLRSPHFNSNVELDHARISNQVWACESRASN